jgi:hypothetical protein
MTQLIDTIPVRGWDSFIPYTQPATMGIPAEIVYHNIRLAGIHFSEQTGILTQKHVVSLQADVDEYPIDVHGCARFLALRKVCYRGQIRYCPAYEPRCCEVSGNKFWVEDGFLRIVPTPSYDEEDALEYEIAVALTHDAVGIPEEFYQDWVETIVAGAIARILSIPGQAFTDYGGSRMYEAKYMQGVRSARYRREASRIRGPMHMVARRFV